MKGTSLLEAIIYLGIVVIVLPLIAAVVFFVVNSRDVGRDFDLVTLEGSRVAQVMTAAIISAKSINSPLIGISSATLSLAMTDANKNPTIFGQSDGSITIKEGTGPQTALTSNKVTVSNLLFLNASQGGTPGSVRGSFAITTANLSKNFYVSASLRKQQ